MIKDTKIHHSAQVAFWLYISEQLMTCNFTRVSLKFCNILVLARLQHMYHLTEAMVDSIILVHVLTCCA